MSTAARKRLAAPQQGKTRAQSAAATRATILRAAVKVFARHGFDGGRVDQISQAANSHDRMIYYYFGSKESLFAAVIEEIYRRFNAAESKLQIDEAQPAQALEQIIAFVWQYYRRHPEFITLLNCENLHRGAHLAKSTQAGFYASPSLNLLDRVLGSGARAGLFRQELSARDIYLMIAAMGYFYLSNRHTLSTFLGENLERPQALAHWQQFITDAVLRTVALPQPAKRSTRHG